MGGWGDIKAHLILALGVSSIGIPVYRRHRFPKCWALLQSEFVLDVIGNRIPLYGQAITRTRKTEILSVCWTKQKTHSAGLLTQLRVCGTAVTESESDSSQLTVCTVGVPF